MTWIIDFRGDLSESSELNRDGSNAMRAVSVVYGTDISIALTNFLIGTKNCGITPTSISHCMDMATFTPKNEIGYTSREIAGALQKLSPESPVIFAFAVSSEAEDCKAIEIA